MWYRSSLVFMYYIRYSIVNNNVFCEFFCRLKVGFQYSFQISYSLSIIFLDFLFAVNCVLLFKFKRLSYQIQLFYLSSYKLNQLNLSPYLFFFLQWTKCINIGISNPPYSMGENWWWMSATDSVIDPSSSRSKKHISKLLLVSVQR